MTYGEKIRKDFEDGLYFALAPADTFNTEELKEMAEDGLVIRIEDGVAWANLDYWHSIATRMV